MLKKAIRGKVAAKTRAFLEASWPSYFLVDVTSHEKSGHIRVYIDGDEGVQFELLRTVSRHLEAWLDEHEDVPEAYELEVSSPGVKRPLAMLRQYTQHVGRTLKITDVDGQQFEAKLLDIVDDQLHLEPASKGKKKKTKEEVVPFWLDFDKIKEALVKLSFG